MNGSQAPVIVAGVDGTPAGQAALQYAVREAVARSGSLTVVTAWNWGGTREGLAGPWTPLEARNRAKQVQDTAVAQALRDLAYAPVMTRRIIEGDPAQVLVQAAKDSDCLVVGSGHKGGFRRAFIGSVSQYCIQHAERPVIVIPPPAETKSA